MVRVISTDDRQTPNIAPQYFGDGVVENFVRIGYYQRIAACLQHRQCAISTLLQSTHHISTSNDPYQTALLVNNRNSMPACHQWVATRYQIGEFRDLHVIRDSWHVLIHDFTYSHHQERINAVLTHNVK